MALSEKIQNQLFAWLLEDLHTLKGLIRITFFSGIIFLYLHTKIGQDFNYEKITYLIICCIIFLLWLNFKYKYPRNKKNKIGIVVALFSKDKGGKKLKDDFIYELQKNLNEFSSIKDFKILEFKNHQSQLLVHDNFKIINLNKKIKADLFLHGDIQKHNDGNGTCKYFLNFEGSVVLNSIPLNLQRELSLDFRNLLPKEFTFDENYAFRCAKATSKIVDVAAKFVVGFAAFLSQKTDLALRIHTDLLENDFTSKYKLFLNEIKGKELVNKLDLKYLSNLKKKLLKIISNEAYVLALGRFVIGDFKACEHFLKISETNDPNNYNLWLLKAIYYVKQEKIDYAMDCIKKAERSSNGRSEWRYSKIFLLFWVEKFNDAYRECVKISNSFYMNENLTVDEVENFNLEITKSRGDKNQLYFYLGYIIMKKRGDFELATNYFNSFLISFNGINSFLEQKARSFIVEMSQNRI